ncbi:MAG: hypothetical protein Q8R79_02420 [Legionellaceae bacterium]|nr:hypothetical protein [Legionellaceae bacterium]
MTNKKLILLCSLFVSSAGYSTKVEVINKFKHPFYAGALGGYGSTTWEGLVPSDENLNLAMSMSTPIDVREGGGVWGFLAGYELNPYFALEANYVHYPDATVFFDPMSLFSFNQGDKTELLTRTETINLMGKIMMFIPNTEIRAYSSAGVAEVHRNDFLIKQWRLSPTFGVGLNYHFTDYLMGELAGNYTAGFGEAQLNPTDSYFPFLYSVSLRIAYCFG